MRGYTKPTPQGKHLCRRTRQPHKANLHKSLLALAHGNQFTNSNRPTMKDNTAYNMGIAASAA